MHDMYCFQFFYTDGKKAVMNRRCTVDRKIDLSIKGVEEVQNDVRSHILFRAIGAGVPRT